MNHAKRAIRAIFIIALITGVLLEITLRFAIDFLPFLQEKISTRPDESLLWKYSAELGWDLPRNLTTVFTNGFFEGRISIDADGIRRNAPQGTYVDGHANILFVGDSTTASFEVDDHETVPAVLERLLRETGHTFNVLNLGARGYGTDQSILKAMKYAEQYNPTDIIYMYTNNDVFDNNALQQMGRRFGKGSFIRSRAGQNFEAHDYPVPNRPLNYAGLVTLDDSCNPVIYEERSTRRVATIEAIEAPTTHQELHQKDVSILKSIKLFLQRHSLVLRVVSILRNDPQRWFRNRQPVDFEPVDPHDFLITKGSRLSDYSWDEYFHKIVAAYADSGLLRKRCTEYFDAQITFLLNKIDRKSKSLRIHVVEFPTEEGLSPGSPASVLFDRLVEQGVIDSHLDLSQVASDRKVSLQSYKCKGDHHFCEKGNRWVASEIQRTLVSKMVVATE